MIYEPQRIQQQGRIIEIGAQDISVSTEHGKGKRIKKDCTGICENCGSAFQKRWSTEPRRFCQNSCQHEFSINRWLKCSMCLAKIGIGGKTSGRLLGVHPTNINRKWKELGIVALKPTNGAWARTSKKTIRALNELNRALWHQYELAWMREVRSECKGFDWSSIAESKVASLRYCRRRKTDVAFRVVTNLRVKLRTVLNRSRVRKSMRTIRFIGCSYNQLKSHLESQFTKQMTWDNYGTFWHVDHILPCKSFDHSDPIQRAQCWHWTNLRPLSAKENLSKSSRITMPQMSLMLCSTY